MKLIFKGATLFVILLLLFPSVYAQFEYVNLEGIDSVDKRIPGRSFTTDAISNTGSVATVSGEQLNKLTSPNFYNTLTGLLAGLYVKSLSQEPGSDAPALSILGFGSYGYGFYNHMRIYVDGFEVDQSMLNEFTPSQIKSVAILKDAAALSTFGMEGANGVIWIESKRGEIGKNTTTVQIKSGIQKPMGFYKPLGSFEFASLYNRAVSNDKGFWDPFYSESQLRAYREGTGTDVDWYNEVYRDYGTYSNVNVAFNGGDDNARYNVVLDYGDQEGLFDVKNTDNTSNRYVRRFNLAGNLDFKMLKIFDVSVNVNGTLSDLRRPNRSGDIAAYPSNIYPVHDTLAKEDEFKYSGTALFPNNPVAAVNATGWTLTKNRRLFSTVKLNEDMGFITEGLKLQERVSFYTLAISNYSKNRSYARFLNGERTTSDQTTSITASDYSPGGMDQVIQGGASLLYDKKNGMSSINSALNFDAYSQLTEGLFGFKEHRMNLSGRFNYTYDSRFVGEFGFSYFGSDAYAPGNRWGFYPSISGSWILSNESFLKNNSDIDFLKVRASIGKLGETYTSGASYAGYESHGRFLYEQYYGSSTSYYTGDAPPFHSRASLKKSFTANPDAFAEQSIKYNLGLDLGLFKNLSITGNLFFDNRTKILTNENFLGYYGETDFIGNIGKMINRGFDLSVSYTNKIGELEYAANGILLFSKNKIKFMDEIPPKNDFNERTGRSRGAIIGLVTEGFYEEDDFGSDGTLNSSLPLPLFGNIQPGDIKYKDLDGDGFIDESDRTQIGESNPQMGFGFGGEIAFKGFDLNFMFQGDVGSYVNLLSSRFQPFVNNGNAFENALLAWSYFPDQGIDNRAMALFPRLTTESNQHNYRTSDLWLRKNDFFRLKNVEFSYDFTRSLLSSAEQFSQFKLFLNAVNPVTFSQVLKDFKLDPETQYNYTNYSSYYIGLRVTF